MERPSRTAAYTVSYVRTPITDAHNHTHNYHKFRRLDADGGYVPRLTRSYTTAAGRCVAGAVGAEGEAVGVRGTGVPSTLPGYRACQGYRHSRRLVTREEARGPRASVRRASAAF